ncbi:unnamed protein product [Brassicogethes aeneus]|uniref:Secreted protein n=1 Tax=Brassicogethes aeneus TaxID=1431903 RepID=A0A9P0FLG1_BRAAE|nr:unnamed protein product [Brassicogethes aeneus]
MKFAVILFVASFVVIAKGQYQFGSFDLSDYPGFGGGLDASYTATRDPRQNTGPVVFPAAPPDNGETSGVVVGASGFGFVPPNSPRSGRQRSF